MADGLGFSEGSGATVSTDDAGAAGHVQIIKLAISADGSATVIPADATYGLDVDVTRIQAIVPGVAATNLGKAEDAAHTTGDTGVAMLAVRTDTEAASSGTDGDYEVLHTDATGNLRTTTQLRDSNDVVLQFATPLTVAATPSIDAGAYSDGDNLDGAIISFADAAAVAAGSGYIDHIQVIDKSDQGGGGKNMTIVFCRSSITPDAQNAAFSLSDAELEEVTQCVTTADADWYDLGDGRVAQVDVSPPRPFEVASGTTLYAVVRLIGAWTFGSTSDVIIRPHFVRN